MRKLKIRYFSLNFGHKSIKINSPDFVATDSKGSFTLAKFSAKTHATGLLGLTLRAKRHAFYFCRIGQESHCRHLGRFCNNFAGVNAPLDAN